MTNIDYNLAKRLDEREGECQVETEECCLLCGASNGQGSGLSNIPCNGKHIMGYCHTHKQDHSKCHEGFIKRKCCNATPMIGLNPQEPKEECCNKCGKKETDHVRNDFDGGVRYFCDMQATILSDFKPPKPKNCCDNGDLDEQHDCLKQRPCPRCKHSLYIPHNHLPV